MGLDELADVGRDPVRGGYSRHGFDAAELTLHVRLIGGDDSQHVLEAIFKALGVALAQAGRPRTRKE